MDNTGVIETNKAHFFGDEHIIDTMMLLTCNYHPRPECRLFRKVLTEMSVNEQREWLNSPKDKRFNW